MVGPEFVEARRLSASEALPLVRNAIVARLPFSFVRMNDGEANILGAYDDCSEDDVKRITMHWWGRDDYTREEILRLRQMLLDAAASADLLGAFDVIDRRTSRWTKSGQLLRKYAALHDDQRFCWPDVHYSWQTEDQFTDLLRGVTDIVYISNFDVSEGMLRKFGFKSVRHIPIPPHAKSGSQALVGPPQYPQRFEEIVKELQGLAPGTVVLVGAGVVGKYYCHTVKMAGGVALDIGSVFDFWASNRKRRSVRLRASRVGF